MEFFVAALALSLELLLELRLDLLELFAQLVGAFSFAPARQLALAASYTHRANST